MHRLWAGYGGSYKKTSCAPSSKSCSKCTLCTIQYRYAYNPSRTVQLTQPFGVLTPVHTSRFGGCGVYKYPCMAFSNLTARVSLFALSTWAVGVAISVLVSLRDCYCKVAFRLLLVSSRLILVYALLNLLTI